MIAGTVLLEDTNLTFNLVNGYFRLTAFDGEREASIETTYEELGAILALALGSDEMDGAEQLYAIAEPAIARLGIRLIP